MNLNQYIKPEHQEGLHSLSLSDSAQADVEKFLQGFGIKDIVEGLPSIADSAYTVVTSVYMQRSAWFRDQPAHTFCAMRVNQIEPVLILARQKPEGWEVRSLSECELPEDYYERRVIEETRAEYF